MAPFIITFRKNFLPRQGVDTVSHAAEAFDSRYSGREIKQLGNVKTSAYLAYCARGEQLDFWIWADLETSLIGAERDLDYQAQRAPLQRKVDLVGPSRLLRQRRFSENPFVEIRRRRNK